MSYTGESRPTPWLAMFAATFAVSVLTLVLFGAFGGLMLLIALNGVSESKGGLIIAAYAVFVLAGNFAVASLINWLIARHRYAGTRGAGWAPPLVALGVTTVMLLVGPPLAVLLMKVIL